jgi:hypothetical protein
MIQTLLTLGIAVAALLASGKVAHVQETEELRKLRLLKCI